MQLFSSKQSLLATSFLGWAFISSVSGRSHFQRLAKRDAYTQYTANETNTEGESHGPIVAPSGSVFTSIPVGNGGEQFTAYWTANADNSSATQAYVMIHGKLRDGDAYWTTMNDILTSAVQANVQGAESNAIIVAPQFFSTVLNSGQYTSDELAWDDINGWQAGDVATHPQGTTLNSFDALDAIVSELSDQTKYPSLTNITVVGHGGGGQMNQRYAMLAQNPPSHIHIRYIHGDPSSCAYFTDDRIQSMADGQTLPSLSSCDLYNTWRYGFDNFTGTAQGLLTPQEYFQQYITRDIISIVGYQDTATGGDTTCMGNIQGGSKRRDRNLSWWQYVNTLARTNEDLTGFPATFPKLPNWSNISNNVIQLQLIVVEDADHDAALVFGSDVGRASLFSTGKMPTGWRPQGWTPAPPLNKSSTNSSSSSNNNKSASSSAKDSSASTSSSSMVLPCFSLLSLSFALSLSYII